MNFGLLRRTRILAFVALIGTVVLWIFYDDSSRVGQYEASDPFEIEFFDAETNALLQARLPVVSSFTYAPSESYCMRMAILTSPKETNQTTANRVNVYRPHKEKGEFYFAILKVTDKSVGIYVHGIDDLISQTIIATGNWERPLVSAVETYLLQNPDVHFLDFGCNLGVYSLAAAALGRRVVAVDANLENIRRLRKSVLRNNFDDLVVTVHNALSNVYANFTVLTANPHNLGGAGIIQVKSVVTANKSNVQSIHADDLLEVIPFKKAAMKIDIECYEFFALQKAHKLFRDIEILVVQMEWTFIGRTSVKFISEYILHFFYSRGYQPYNQLVDGVRLKRSQIFNWPQDIVWIRSPKNEY